MSKQWSPSNFWFAIDGIPAGAGMWISALSFSPLDASSRQGTGTQSTLPLTVFQRVAELEAYFKNVSGLSYESEVVDSVAKIDGFCIKQTIKPADPTVHALVLLSFEPSQSATRHIKSRTGELILFDDTGVPGRIALMTGTRMSASWHFDRGWFYAASSTLVAPGSPGSVLLLPENLRRG